MEDAPTQLVLRVDRPDWRLDERTREIGRNGLADARASLRAGRRKAADNEAAAAAARASATPTSTAA